MYSSHTRYFFNSKIIVIYSSFSLASVTLIFTLIISGTMHLIKFPNLHHTRSHFPYLTVSVDWGHWLIPCEQGPFLPWPEKIIPLILPKSVLTFLGWFFVCLFVCLFGRHGYAGASKKISSFSSLQNCWCRHFCVCI